MRYTRNRSKKRPVPTSDFLVVGLGVSGYWTAKWLAGQGAQVTVSETRDEAGLDAQMVKELRELGIRLETGGHQEETFLTTGRMILSPGVPHDMPAVKAASMKGIPVVGELEFAARLIDAPIIAVTGTNGKSTVTECLGVMLKNAGHTVFVGGNIGTPLMAYVAQSRKADYVVAEVSSFQLDTIEAFRPEVSMILNISPDHLDRYPDYAAYVEAKLRIFQNQRPGTHVILNDDDPQLSSSMPPAGVSVARYGMEKKPGRAAFIEGGHIRARLQGPAEAHFSLDAFSLSGKHNLENLMGIVLAGLILRVDAEMIQRSIDAFKGLPHRLERIGEFKGVFFYNDSKATNVDAAVRAVGGVGRPLVLIAGGRHKGGDYAPLVQAAAGRVKAAVFIGEAKELLAKSFESHVPFSFASDMEEAVRKAYSKAEAGDAVLLAPACSSFDMFTDYSHRGRMFKRALEGLFHG